MKTKPKPPEKQPHNITEESKFITVLAQILVDQVLRKMKNVSKL